VEASLPDPKSRPQGVPRWLKLLGGLSLLAALALGALAWWAGRLLAPAAPGATHDVELEVLPGWGASEVASALEDAGLVRSGRAFSLYLRAAGLDRSVGEGLYNLSPGLSAPDIARRLGEGGRARTVTVVIPEGFRAVQVAERLAALELVGPEFSALIADPGELRPAFVPEGVGLEGYLFPASYELPLQATAEGVLSTMLNRFERVLTPERRAQLDALGLSVHEWVTLASMIQAEAGHPGEMPIIAGVFLNRLELGMPLQSDPTVAYGLGKRLPELSALEGDLQRDHPWNTYTRTGLPVGPIGNPGEHALEVIFHAQRTNEDGEPYLYFLHGLGGEFRPNLTLEDHNRDVETFLRP
jgi:UPF0755 protein